MEDFQMTKPNPLEDSNVLCLIPWTHLHIWPNSSAHLCCNSDSFMPLGKLSDGLSMQDMWNSPRMKEIRLDMLQNKPIRECRRCYEVEKSGIRSMRQDHNLTFAHHVDKIQTTKADGTVEEMNMPYMDIRFSNICNFRCRTCGPELSSSWFKDAKALNIPMQHNKPLLHPTDDLTLWEQVEKILPTVELIYFAGGEPLIMEEHYRILNWLIKHEKFEVELRYNTNFSMTSFQGQDVFELWKKFKKVEVGASLDSFGPRAEYMRKDTNWALIESNRKRMLEICPQVSFYVSVTLSVFSFSTMAEFQQDWVNRGLVGLNDWNVNPLTYPLHYRVHVAPVEYRKNIIEEYKKHLEWIKARPHHNQMTLDRWNSAIAFLEGDQLKEELKNFKSMTKSLDDLRQESFASTFTELAFLLHE
jgi:organic radical activating enzyme